MITLKDLNQCPLKFFKKKLSTNNIILSYDCAEESDDYGVVRSTLNNYHYRNILNLLCNMLYTQRKAVLGYEITNITDYQNLVGSLDTNVVNFLSAEPLTGEPKTQSFDAYYKLLDYLDLTPPLLNSGVKNALQSLAVTCDYLHDMQGKIYFDKVVMMSDYTTDVNTPTNLFVYDDAARNNLIKSIEFGSSYHQGDTYSIDLYIDTNSMYFDIITNAWWDKSDNKTCNLMFTLGDKLGDLNI